MAKWTLPNKFQRGQGQNVYRQVMMGYVPFMAQSKIEQFNKAIELFGELAQNDDIRRAIAVVKKSLSVSKFKIGEVLFSQGNHEEAINSFLACLEIKKEIHR